MKNGKYIRRFKFDYFRFFDICFRDRTPNVKTQEQYLFLNNNLSLLNVKEFLHKEFKRYF